MIGVDCLGRRGGQRRQRPQRTSPTRSSTTGRCSGSRLHDIVGRPDVQGALSIAVTGPARRLPPPRRRSRRRGSSRAIRLPHVVAPHAVRDVRGLRRRRDRRATPRSPCRQPTAWRLHTQLDADYLDALIRDRCQRFRDRLTLPSERQPAPDGRSLALRRVTPRRARAQLPPPPGHGLSAPATGTRGGTSHGDPRRGDEGRRHRRRGCRAGRPVRRAAGRRPGSRPDVGGHDHRPASTRHAHRRPRGTRGRGSGRRSQ